MGSRYLPEEANAGLVPSPIAELEKEQIKALIVSLTLCAPPRIQSPISEALAIIGKHDFPKSCPALIFDYVTAVPASEGIAPAVLMTSFLNNVTWS